MTIEGIAMQSGDVRSVTYPVFVERANLIDITEPLEDGDMIDGLSIVGMLDSSADKDSYALVISNCSPEGACYMGMRNYSVAFN